MLQFATIQDRRNITELKVMSEVKQYKSLERLSILKSAFLPDILQKIKRTNHTRPEYHYKIDWQNDFQKALEIWHLNLDREADRLVMIITLAGSCRMCGCTDDDCRQCIEKTGGPCSWTEPGLCSACKDLSR